MAVRDEVQRQRECDKNWPSHAPEVLLATRLRALSEARRKHAEGDPDAVHAMRQGLVDIAAGGGDRGELGREPGRQHKKCPHRRHTFPQYRRWVGNPGVSPGARAA